ncbi:MAG: hypothetical protein LBC40_09910, partial [Dysgonamonadaceae bacterium]|nr:hypothetical protein [Dysgonamonadaceae bacterium]
MKRILFMVFIYVNIFVSINSQVTIGSGIVPQEGLLLELRQWNEDVDGATATKGFLPPKVKLVSYDSLTPLYPTTVEPQKSKSKGVVVYNVNENGNAIRPGLHMWNG